MTIEPTGDAVPLLRVRNLRKSFTRRSLFGSKQRVHAVDDIDLDVRAGKTLGIVGESGSGKSTLGRAVLNLTSIDGGSVEFDGQDLGKLSPREMKLLRRRMQIVFQDPYSSLHPRMSVRQVIYEGLRAGGKVAAMDRATRAAELMDAVGLGPQHLDVYPHKLSGGQRQRVAIARALSVDPALIVADEAVSALDVSIQAQILNMLADVQAKFGLTYLFVSHDLNVIRYLADRVVVLYRGRIAEEAPAETLFASPQHPYTRLLLAAMPRSDRLGYGTDSVPEAPPANVEVPVDACQFYVRCPYAADICLSARPALRLMGPGHKVACVRAPLDLGAVFSP